MRCDMQALLACCTIPALFPQGWVALHPGDFVHFAIDTAFPDRVPAGEEVTLAVAYLA